MGADNWTLCPRCTALRQTAIAVKEAALETAYGTVPVGEFLEMKAAVEAYIAEEPKRTLREDYEFYGASEGVVHIRYSCSCQTCGLRFKIEDEREIRLA